MVIWHQWIEEVASLEELVTLARDYLASWEPETLALIPASARPTQVKGADDLAYWHQRLVESYCSGAAKSLDCEHLRDLLHFFACALQRAAELRGVPPVSEHEAAARLFSDHSVPKLFTSAMTGSAER